MNVNIEKRGVSLSENLSLRERCAVELQVVRECIPGPLMSDHATEILLDSLEKIATEIGTERFHQVVMKAIETCERRPTIATYRRLAGLTTRMSPQDEALAAAWEIVTVVVTRFLLWDGNGNCSVKPRVTQEYGHYREELPPDVPPSALRAVQSMGGWRALADSYPHFWAHKFGTFKELLRLTPDEVAALTAPKSTALAKT